MATTFCGRAGGICLLALACSGGDKGGLSTGTSTTDDGGGGSGGPPVFEDFINTTVTATGDFTGFEGGKDAAGGWLDPGAPAEGCVVERPVAGMIEDFESELGVGEATLEVWYVDAVSGAADLTLTSDPGTTGSISGGSMLVCQPLTYKVSTDPALDDTVPTIESHLVVAYTDGSVGERFNSVSKSTYQLIPSLLGISVDPTRGTAAGTVYDMNGAPVKGAQVIVRDASETIPSGMVVRYFIDRFPNRDQPETSEDGLWVAVNIPPGDWAIDAYIYDGSGGYLLMGSTTVTIFADSINIGNIQVGYDGVRYPDTCLSACGG